MTPLRLRAGERTPVLWVGAVGLLYAAAVGLGDVLAQSIFVARAGAEALPHIFLLKAVIDLGAAALYGPLTRGRHPGAVLRLTLVLYALVILGGRAALALSTGVGPAYLLYVAHESTWTLLTIHWAVYLLDIFDVGQARRLFPILFAVSRVGAALAGAAAGILAVKIGAPTLLVAAAGLAAAASLVSLAPHAAPHDRAVPMQGEAPSDAEVDEEAAVAAAAPAERAAARPWLGAWQSPLVRAIALSTACMVAVRYALRLVSVGRIEHAFHGDEDLIAQFLGAFDGAANLIGAGLAVLVMPRLLHRAGVGAVHLGYAVATVAAHAVLLLWPSLAAAAAGRFAELALKDAIKTPLSAIFYGAERPPRRGPARAVVFGLVIPAATLVTAVVLEATGTTSRPLLVAGGFGAAAAVLFTWTSWRQNRAWRAQLWDLLDWKLARTGPPPAAGEAALARARDALLPHATGDGDRLEPVARALASSDRRLRAVGEEILAETILRAEAHRIARTLERPDRS